MQFTLAAACLLGAAIATEAPTMIESKLNHFVAAEEHDYSVVINQTKGEDYFTISEGTRAMPNPVCVDCKENFHIDGVWNVENSDLATVEFTFGFPSA